MLFRSRDILNLTVLSTRELYADGTGYYQDPSSPKYGLPEFYTLAPDVPAWLGAQGVRLIGLDVPSVDQVDSTTIPIHRALDAANIIILENLDLRAAPAGVYELISLPLKIAGGDGSPIRAVLRAE